MKRFRIPILIGIIVICVGIIAGSFTYIFLLRHEKVGTLFINSIPEKGMVYLNGELKGLTPITLTSIPAEEYSLKIIKDGFQDWGEVITVLPSKRVDKIATLVKMDVNPPKISSTPVTTSFANREIPIVAEITDDIKVEGAYLFYRKVGDRDFISLNMHDEGDKYKASIPSSSVSEKGVEYYITATDGVNTAYFPSDPSRPLEIKIKPKPLEREAKYVPKRPSGGSIHIVSEPSGAKAYLEGRYKGETPLKVTGLEPWKAYELLLTHKEYGDWRTKTFVEPNGVTEIKAVLKEGVKEKVEEKVVKVAERKGIEEERPRVVKKETGMVYITSLPPRAKVYIDGRLIGETPIRGIKIEVGKSNIKVVKEGYPSSTKEVFVEKDRMTYVNFTLEEG
ncbi:MAG: PEGA domain-containing protein [bacterium]|nr:PEGA domain-containing protein [bacterium]